MLVTSKCYWWNSNTVLVTGREWVCAAIQALEMKPEVILGFPLLPQELTIMKEIFAENKLINSHFTHHTAGLCAQLTPKMLLRSAGKQGWCWGCAGLDLGLACEECHSVLQPWSPSPAQRWQGQGLPWSICALVLSLSGCLLLSREMPSFSCAARFVHSNILTVVLLQWFTVSYWESLLYSRDTGCKEECHRLWHRFQPTQSWQDLSIREDKFFFFMTVLIKTRIPSAPFASLTHSILLPFIP